MDKITIERETLERAIDALDNDEQDPIQVGELLDALRAALAAQPAEAQQEPVAWVIPGNDNASAKGFIDAMAWQEGEFSRPLYAAPPAPAAVPPAELTWLFTHCRAIGMVEGSESGKWEHDIALFTQRQAERIRVLSEALTNLEAMAERYRPPGYPIPDAQKAARAALEATK